MKQRLLMVAAFILGCAGWAWADSLPDGYLPLAWIGTATGSEYIDTGYVPGTDDAVEASVSVAAAQPAAQNALFGYRDANGQFVGFQPNTDSATQTAPAYAWGGVRLTGAAGAFPVDVFASLRCQNETAVWTSTAGGGLLTLTEPAGAAGASSLLIFNGNTSSDGTARPDAACRGKFKLASFRILGADDSVRRNFLPCRRRADAVVGLYESVEGKFYVNAAAGRLVGPDDVDVRYGYVRLNGSQYFDTGYKHTKDTAVTLEYNVVQPTATPDKSFQALFGTRDANDSDHSLGFFIWSTWNAAGDNNPHYLRDYVNKGFESGRSVYYSEWTKMVCGPTGASWWRLADPSRPQEIVNGAASVGGASSYTLHINGFNVKGGNGGRCADIKFRSFQIADANGVVRNYLPMRRLDGSVGFYDTVAGRMLSTAGVYGGVLHTVSADGRTIEVREGTFTAEDIVGYETVEKAGPYELNAAAVTDYPNLTLAAGRLSLADGQAGLYRVDGRLRLLGGATLRMELMPDGNDALTVDYVDLTGASAENPFILQLVASGQGAYGADGPIMLVARGMARGDEAKIRVEGFPVSLSVNDDGALLATVTADPNAPFSALWTGRGDRADLADPANWTCWNYAGELLAGAVPVETTAVAFPAADCTFSWPAGQVLPCSNLSVDGETITLATDCDWTGFDVNRSFLAGKTIDLQGHTLRLGGVGGETACAFAVTDSTAPGGLCVIDVPEGTAMENTRVTFDGSLALVKAGNGCLIPRVYGQTYTGGTRVEGGTLKLFNDDVADSATFAFTKAGYTGALGVDGSTLTIGRDGTLDLNGVYDTFVYPYVFDGGTLVNSKKQGKYDWGSIGAVTLTADTVWNLDNSTVLLDSAHPAFDFGGHTLTVNLADDIHLYRKNVDLMRDGTLVLRGGGLFDTHGTELDAKTVVFDVDAPLLLNKDVHVGTYVARYTGDRDEGNGRLHVYDTFTPLADRYHAVVLHEGAVIDLSARTETWRVQGPFGSLAFDAEATNIVLDLGARTLEPGERLVAWPEVPAGITFTVRGDNVAADDELSIVPSGIFYNVPADSTVVTTAAWTGAAGDGDRANPANWICQNPRGNVVPDAVPGELADVTVSGPVALDFPADAELPWFQLSIGDCTLTADCDWRGLAPYTEVLVAGTTIDLNGHRLFVNAPAGTATRALSVTDSSTVLAAPGEFHFTVAEGATFVNTGTTFSGNLRLVKEGAGVFTPQVYNLGYTGGNVVLAGTLRFNNPVGSDNSEYALGQTKHPNPLGAYATDLVVGEGAVVDIKGLYDMSKHHIVLDGGSITNDIVQTKTTWGALGNVSLTADSFCKVGAKTVLRGAYDLGGHTLSSTIAPGAYLYLNANPVSNGTFRVVSGGWLEICSAADYRTVDLDLGGALKLRGDVQVRNYTARYRYDANEGTAALNVYGCFLPAAATADGEYFYGCTLQDGATLDLTAKTAAWSTKSLFTNGRNEVAFAPGARIRVDLTGRTFTFPAAGGAEQIIAWETAPDGSVVFTADAGTMSQGRRLARRADGLYLLKSGLAVLFR